MSRAIQSSNPEVLPVDAMAEAITEICNHMRAISKSRVTRKMIVALIHDRSNLTKGTIEIVLNNLDDLEKTWLKPRDKA